MRSFEMRAAIVDLLVRIEQDSGYSHLLIDHEIKSRQLSTKDGALLTEIVYGVVQMRMTLDYYLNPFLQTTKKIQPWVRSLLRMSVYQMQWLDRVPDHAVIHDAVEIAKHRGHKGIQSFINGVLRNIQRKGVPDPSDIDDDIQRLSIETSHPEWLVKRWMNIYGWQMTIDMCYANNQPKPMSVRVQPLKISREQAMNELNEQGFVVRASNFSEQGMIIDEGNVFTTRLFDEGCLTIQDQSSMLVTEMLKAKPGMAVLDACSAPGGKATHTAEKMQNEGTIAAYDLHAKKAKQIKQKADQLNLTIITAGQGDARKLQSNHKPESFDRILVDAPCTGFGVIRGKPDIKYNKQEEDIGQLARIQIDILEQTAPLLKKGGLLIYSTCTVDRTENEHVVNTFLQRHSEYKVDETFVEDLPSPVRESPGQSATGLQLFPQTFSTDGFFLTRILRV
ncbi:16S rRNA (cytosine(967)-C(5))-methyltransferase RsmB [Lentibacillus halophilus]|uniref:16S rRNA (cytosine(967)-C(5))-methyltransferase n=1 Tax=Lentibacillus halophilus TaxID=295065 RepID=A0ABN0ZF06_9BACI